MDAGAISARIEAGMLVIVGETVKHERFLADQFKWAKIRWDAGEHAWIVNLSDMYASDLIRMRDFFGLTLDD